MSTYNKGERFFHDFTRSSHPVKPADLSLYELLNILINNYDAAANINRATEGDLFNARGESFHRLQDHRGVGVRTLDRLQAVFSLYDLYAGEVVDQRRILIDLGVTREGIPPLLTYCSDDLLQLEHKDPLAITQIGGVGKGAVARLIAAFELVRREALKHYPEPAAPPPVEQQQVIF